MSPVANAKKKRKGAANAGLQPVVEQQLAEDQPSPEQESEVNPSPDVDAGADEGDQGDHEGTPPPPLPSDGRVGTEEALRARALSSHPSTSSTFWKAPTTFRKAPSTRRKAPTTTR